jgi:hypothetical protein
MPQRFYFVSQTSGVSDRHGRGFTRDVVHNGYLAAGLLVLNPNGSRILSISWFFLLYSTTSFINSLIAALRPLICETWNCRDRNSRVFLMYDQQKTNESTALIASNASNIVVKGLFFIFKSGGNSTGSPMPLSNSFLVRTHRDLQKENRTRLRGSSAPRRGDVPGVKIPRRPLQA